jgi:hypothetical protein
MNLISQLPPALIFLGEFNAHNTLWGSVLTDNRSKTVSNVSIRFDLIFLNMGALTLIFKVRELFCPGPHLL